MRSTLFARDPLPGSAPARRRAAWLTVTAAAAAGLLAGCASATSSQAGGTPAAGQASSNAQGANGTATPAHTATATPATSSAPGLGGLALCQASSLQVSVSTNQTGVAMGSSYYPVDFTNTASEPCGLYGYPGVSFVTTADSAGRQIGAAAQKNPSYGKVAVELAAGGSAHAWLQVAQAGNYPSATCRPETAHGLRIYAPGETQALYVDRTFSACASGSVQLLTVMPVRSGHGVEGSTP